MVLMASWLVRICQRSERLNRTVAVLNNEHLFDNVATPMGFHNPSVPWSELEKILSGRAPDAPPKFEDSVTPVVTQSSNLLPYAELHCHSNFCLLYTSDAADE